ncbi:MAG: hypothetical protein EXQ47_10895 [Bryobacterales bacterium]|nr:hypothetical protein [Bryobacterales bacterium]
MIPAPPHQMNRLLTIAALLAGMATPGWSLDTSKLKPTGYVNDFAGVLDGGSKQALEEYAANLERVTGAQMAIVLVPTLDGDPVEDAANRLYREWGIGQKGKNEGLLLLLAIRDRKSRAEVGYGLEPIITDGQAGGILRAIAPILRQGNYGGGLLAAAETIGRQIAQEKGVDLSGGQPEQRIRRRSPGPSIPFPLIVIGIIILLSLLSRGGSGGGGFLTGMILGNMMGGRGGWGGGGFGGGGGGGGGFGGFSGGDSGGGGTSSDW